MDLFDFLGVYNGIGGEYNKNNIDELEEDNSNNGLMTKIWGPSLWMSLHCITFGYPKEPTPEHKEKYKMFFTLIGDVMPCGLCRESYKEFISTDDTKLTDDVFTNRETLTRWLFLVHERVNKKLGVTYGITYQDVVKKYEAFRAKCKKSKDPQTKKGCIMPMNAKAQSYKVAYNKDCAIICEDIAEKFMNYAKERGLSDDDFDFINTYMHNKNTLRNKCTDINCNVWYKRNQECFNTIVNMRINNINSVETEGKYEGLPTIDELKLIMRLSSNLTCDELKEISKKLPKKRRFKRYILKK